jgi:hypothetical protein
VAQDVAQTPSMRHNPTPRTDAATYPADCLGKTQVVHRDLAAALETELREAEQEDNAANHYLSRAEKAEAELTELRARISDPAPRTTEEEWEEWPKKWLVRADLARELETELTEARKEIEEQARLLGISGSEVAALKRPLLRLTSLWHQLLFLLEITEESDSGNEFRPNYISSCRAVDGDRIQKILEEAKQLVNANVKNQHPVRDNLQP